MSFAARITRKPTVEKRRTCSNCGRLGHLVSTCANPERFHNMIGIEIEGWWYDLPKATEEAKKLTGSPGRADGSIRGISTCAGTDQDNPDDYNDPDVEDCEEGCDDCPHPIARRTAPRCDRGKTDCKACGARGWEFQTKPGSVGEALRQLTQLYPDVTSRAAGMHVHMSFKEATSVTLLCSDAFFAYWKDRWEKWGTKLNVQGAFWERLRNENQYCRPNSMNDFQNKGKKDLIDNGQHNRDDRYKAINFLAYNKTRPDGQPFKTVEFRLLPMFQKGNLAVNAIETLVDIVETFLQTYQIDTEIVGQPTKLAKDKDEAVAMEPVDVDFDLPVLSYPAVTCELDIEAAFTPGETPDGTMKMLRYQEAEFYSQRAAAVQSKLSTIADPKRNKVDWETFNADA